MKAISQPAVITPNILFLILLAAAVVFIGAIGRKVPLFSNIRVDIILVVVLGMAICTQGGIGRVAATGEWWHPLSILGYLLDGNSCSYRMINRYCSLLRFLQGSKS
ncbi:MAG TPA: hypothetical protein VJ821_02365 [Anaerolineales bacterium]|nr:hypothetical protein [Anaerolineales bacterium]